MKKFSALAVAAALCLSLAACSTVDLNTPKSAELSAQYNFYNASASEIRVEMKLTPEQSDEVFIALVSVGMGSKPSVNKKYGTDNTYSVSWSGSIGSREVDLADGVVSEIRNGVDVVYPLERSTETLNRAAVENVTALIEALSVNSARSDYESAQAAYDALSKNLKKEIPETLTEKLASVDVATQTLELLVESLTEGVDVTDVKIVNDGKTDAADDMMVTIYADASDNLTQGLIRAGILLDSTNIFKGLQPRSDVSQVCLIWAFPLVDAYGNTAPETVMKILLTKPTLDKINFDSFNRDNYATVAEDYYEHPALSK